MVTKEITVRLRPDQVRTVRKLYPEVSLSVIARVLFDLFLLSPYDEEMQDNIHEESERTNAAIKSNQFKRKEKRKHEPKPAEIKFREQLLRSLRVPGPDNTGM